MKGIFEKTVHISICCIAETSCAGELKMEEMNNEKKQNIFNVIVLRLFNEYWNLTG